MRAQPNVRARKSNTRSGVKLEADVPGAVRIALGAQDGDRIVFEEGTSWVAERAAGEAGHDRVTVNPHRLSGH